MWEYDWEMARRGRGWPRRWGRPRARYPYGGEYRAMPRRRHRRRHPLPPPGHGYLYNPWQGAVYPAPDLTWGEPSYRRGRNRYGPWRPNWRPDEAWWHNIGPEPRADYDWAYGGGPPERYGWPGETGRG